ncbi:extracellular matrix regulator RemB [Peribacillus sp. SCS-26]|uniref:extracellular matrix regulator RemB n=1 Tax=Paraperibacillus marinus TaxID=3115295 RepID=UPI003906285B
MYLHVGEDTLVKTNDIIVILDRQLLKNSDIFKEFMEKRKDRAVHLAKGEIKSVVITETMAYLSPFSSAILKKRAVQFMQPAVTEKINGNSVSNIK